MFGLLLLSEADAALDGASAAVKRPNIHKALVSDRENVAIHVVCVVQLSDAFEVPTEFADLFLLL